MRYHTDERTVVHMGRKVEECGLDRQQIGELIDRWIFSERDRKLLCRRMLDNIRFDDLAEEFDLSVRQTKKIVYKGEERVLAKANPWKL